MSVKVVYASQSVAFYVSGSDVDLLLQGYALSMPLYVEREMIVPQGGQVQLLPGIPETLKPIVEADRAAVIQAKVAFRAANPDYRSARVRGKKTNG